VIVRFVFAVAAVLAAISVSTLVVLVEAGENVAVTPAGNPEMLRATLPAGTGVDHSTETVLVNVVPGANCATPLPAWREKVPGAIVSENVLVVFSDPETPVTVTVETPGAAVLVAVRLSCELPVTTSGAKEPVTPAGSPLTERVALPVKPNTRVTET